MDYVLQIERKNGIWYWSYPEKGITNEILAYGASESIDKLRRMRKLPMEGLALIVSTLPLGQGEAVLSLVKAKNNRWSKYREQKYSLEGWITPVLYQFFTKPPTTLYVQLTRFDKVS